VYFIVLPVVVPFNINIIIITIIFIIFFYFFFFFSRLCVLCVHYRSVRFSYYTGDQFIEPYGSSGSLPLFSYYHDNYCSLLYVAENKLVVVVVTDRVSVRDKDRRSEPDCRSEAINFVAC